MHCRTWPTCVAASDKHVLQHVEMCCSTSQHVLHLVWTGVKEKDPKELSKKSRLVEGVASRLVSLSSTCLFLYSSLCLFVCPFLCVPDIAYYDAVFCAFFSWMGSLCSTLLFLCRFLFCVSFVSSTRLFLCLFLLCGIPHFLSPLSVHLALSLSGPLSSSHRRCL